MWCNGTAIAMYYGNAGAAPGARLDAAAQFFVSPTEMTLLAHKMRVLLQRVEAKDYFDIAALIESGARLDRAGVREAHVPTRLSAERKP